jgi:predicted DNA-binding protein
MMASTTSFRLPDRTREHLRALCRELGMTQTQVLVLAIDRMAREELAGFRGAPRKEEPDGTQR